MVVIVILVGILTKVPYFQQDKFLFLFFKTSRIFEVATPILSSFLKTRTLLENISNSNKNSIFKEEKELSNTLNLFTKKNYFINFRTSSIKKKVQLILILDILNT